MQDAGAFNLQACAAGGLDWRVKAVGGGCHDVVRGVQLLHPQPQHATSNRCLANCFRQLQRRQLPAPLNRRHAEFYSKTVRIKGRLNSARSHQSIQLGRQARPVVFALQIRAHKLKHLLLGRHCARDEQGASGNEGLQG
jgi:hypothetical protein